MFKIQISANLGLAFPLVRNALINAVNKRVANTDRDIACLLSGGLDSSLISALVSHELVNTYGWRRKNLHTWSIGLEGSEDLVYAKIVADYIGSTHHEIKLSEKDFFRCYSNCYQDYRIKRYYDNKSKCW